jgi:hypothetical protein
MDLKRLREAKIGAATHMDLKRALDSAREDAAINGQIDLMAAMAAKHLSAGLVNWENAPMVANRPPNNSPSFHIGFLSTSASLQILSYESFRNWVGAIQRKRNEV